MINSKIKIENNDPSTTKKTRQSITKPTQQIILQSKSIIYITLF